MTPVNHKPRGNFAPVTDECSALDLEVTGRIPAGLDGQYVRTGSNALAGTDPRQPNRPADAGMVHGTRLGSGRALGYRNRWIRPPSIPQPIERDVLVPAGDGSAALFLHAGSLYATAELGLPCLLSNRLETLGLCDFGAPLPAGAAPHARHDPRSGELHVLSYHFEPPYVRHHRIDSRGQLLESRQLPWQRPSMVHDFGLLDSHLVVFDLPVLFSEDALLDGQPLPYRWFPTAGARIGLVPRNGPADDAEWFELDPCWVTHLAGVRREGNRIVIDAIVASARIEPGRAGETEGACRLGRFTLDRSRNAALLETLDNDPQEQPMRDDRLPYGDGRWLWTTAQDQDADGFLPAGCCLYRHDLVTGERAEVWMPERGLCGEVTFVPADERAPEGKGWLVGYVWQPEDDRSELLVLDAMQPEAAPLARVSLPQRVPFGTHGCWLPGR